MNYSMAGHNHLIPMYIPALYAKAMKQNAPSYHQKQTDRQPSGRVENHQRTMDLQKTC